MQPEFDQHFYEQFYQAITGMFTSSEYNNVITRFLSAYEYRKQFPWLEEHGGLAYALQAALATYLVDQSSASEESGGPLDRLDEKERASDSTEALIKAVSATKDEGLSLERFRKRLLRANVPVESMQIRVLQLHIASALDSYARRYMIGLSPDPF